MPNTKITQILWLTEQVRQAANIQLWLTSSGDIITGRPITSSEYFQLIIAAPAGGSPLTEDLLPLRDVVIRHGATHHTFSVALVDLNLVVAWGAYDPTAGDTSGSGNKP